MNKLKVAMTAKTQHPKKETDGWIKVRRIRQAIDECDAFIKKEDPRASDLRPADVQQHLDFCKAHKIRLLAMIPEVNLGETT